MDFDMDIKVITIVMALGLCCSSGLWNQEKDNHAKIFDDDNNNCECGRANHKIKIVGGQATRKHEYPWMISLHDLKDYIFKGAYDSIFCGGSIISKQWAITAAHCVYDYVDKPYMLLISVGRHNLKSLSGYKFFPKLVSSIQLHPEYNDGTQQNDVALIKFFIPTRFTTEIRPVCLPFPDYVNYTGRSLVVSGWGALAEGGSGSEVLHEVNVIGIRNDICDSMYSSTGINVFHSMLCAGIPEGGKDSCQGDSGGPLVMKCKSRYILIGVVSFGIGCARPHFPGVYTRISEMKDWINNVTGSTGSCSNNCTASYTHLDSYKISNRNTKN